MAKPVSAFVDVVGVRAMAADGVDAYYDQLHQFHKAVWGHASVLEGKGQVFFFSDCCYVEAQEAGPLVSFLAAIRGRLLLRGVFFRAAVLSGALQPVDAGQLPESADGRRNARDMRGNVVRGYHFGRVAAELFGRQEQLKGIGIWMDAALKVDRKAGAPVMSCFVPEVGKGTARSYVDLAFPPGELTPDRLTAILTAFFDAKTRVQKLGRYYVPLLVTWVQSLELGRQSEDVDDGPSLTELMVRGDFHRLFGDVVGIEQVYFCLLNRAHEKRAAIGEEAFLRIREAVLEHRQVVRRVGHVPREILTPQVRKSVLTKMSMDVVRPGQRERARSMASSLAAAGQSMAEIIRELSRAGIAAPGGGRWKEEIVRGLLGEPTKRDRD